MREFEQRKKVRRIVYSRLSVALLVVLVGILGKASYSAYHKYQVSTTAYQDVAREHSELSSRKGQLENDIARLKTKEGIEADIRTKFGMVKEGEQMLVLVDRGTTTQVVPAKASAFDALKSLFRR